MSRAIDAVVLRLCEGLLRLIGRHALANLVGRDSVEPMIIEAPWGEGMKRWWRSDPYTLGELRAYYDGDREGAAERLRAYREQHPLPPPPPPLEDYPGTSVV